MKTTHLTLATLAMAASAFAGEKVTKTYHPPERECFRAHEFQVDLFGQYSVGKGPNHAGPIRDHGWGGGVGLNYFFTRHLGLGLDAAWLSAAQPAFTPLAGPLGAGPLVPLGARRTTMHNFSGSVIYRFPIDRICTAPYVFAGGGFAVDGLQWASVHGGLGIEHRFSTNLGIFTDGRWTYYGERFGRGDLNNFSVRVGVRVVF